MIHGILIGLILFSLIIHQANQTTSKEAIIARVISLFVFLPSVGGLVGLLIQGA